MSNEHKPQAIIVNHFDVFTRRFYYVLKTLDKRIACLHCMKLAEDRKDANVAVANINTKRRELGLLEIEIVSK